MRVAQQYAATGKYAEAKSLVDVAKQIDAYCDAWSFWEGQFRKLRETELDDAVEVLRCMVQGEHDRERLRTAVRLYGELKKRQPANVPPPPPEIGAEMDRSEFQSAVAAATLALQGGDRQDALAKLDSAGSRFPTLWSGDEMARKIRDGIRCDLLFDAAHECLNRGELETAEGKVNECLEIRPGDKQVRELRDAILQKPRTVV